MSRKYDWICAVCRNYKSEKPAHEKQHLFPGCGGVCGYQSRICSSCFALPLKLEEVCKADHEEHHRRVRPTKDAEPQRHAKKEEPK